MNFISLKDWLNKLIEYSKLEDVVVLVEGKNDVKRLSALGVKNLYPLKGKKFYDVVEELESCKICILLLDLDKHGEKIFQKLRYLLEREGIPTESSFRKYLKNFNIDEIEFLSVERTKCLQKE